MSLQAQVARAFDPSGPLSQAVEAFRPRAGQTAMAMEVARTMEHGGALVVEAGTGVGKTFAYLIPALLSGERVVISTATKALQDQLFSRDIPGLCRLLGLPVRVAMLKGRSSYLCTQRLDLAAEQPQMAEADHQAQLAMVRLWAAATGSGDLAEMQALDERSEVIPWVTSTRENCLGNRCPQAPSCYVNKARREAMNADMVVVNHHLFFADLNVRESGVAELLPLAKSVVFDEAHQLNEIGVQFLGQQLTTGQLEDFFRDLAKMGGQLALVLSDWRQSLSEIQQCVVVLRAVCGNEAIAERRAWVGASPQGVDPQAWSTALAALRSGLVLWVQILQPLAPLSPEMQLLGQRAERLLASIDVFTGPLSPGFVRWLEIDRQMRWVQSPLDIAEAMRTRVVHEPESEPSGKSWIFTSATLGHDEKLAWFVDACGLDSAKVLQVESPFDHLQQSALYVPQQFPKPGDPSHSAQVAALVADAATVLRGRTLVLTTTLRAMHAIGDALRIHFSQSEDPSILVQGQASKRELLALFRESHEALGFGSVLVGAASFWEGIDIPGDALQMVVIDKLPFPPPGDPLVEARGQNLKLHGGNSFKDYHLPQAAVALKQGAGRLIRRETDRGVLVVCDTRLTGMGYGKKLISALPKMRVLVSEEAFYEALSELTRPSTTDPYWS